MRNSAGKTVHLRWDGCISHPTRSRMLLRSQNEAIGHVIHYVAHCRKASLFQNVQKQWYLRGCRGATLQVYIPDVRKSGSDVTSCHVSTKSLVSWTISRRNRGTSESSERHLCIVCRIPGSRLGGANKG